MTAGEVPTHQGLLEVKGIHVACEPCVPKAYEKDQTHGVMPNSVFFKSVKLLCVGGAVSRKWRNPFNILPWFPTFVSFVEKFVLCVGMFAVIQKGWPVWCLKFGIHLLTCIFHFCLISFLFCIVLLFLLLLSV